MPMGDGGASTSPASTVATALREDAPTFATAELEFRSSLYLPIRVDDDRPRATLLVARRLQRPWQLTQIEAARRTAVRCGHALRQRQRPPDRMVAPSPTESDTTPRGLRVMMVEDEPHIVRWLQRQLAAWGHEITTCTSVADAREQLAIAPDWPDLLIVDVHLPDGSALDVVDHARALGVSASRWIVTTGGIAGPELHDRLHEELQLLPKPFDTETLRRTLDDPEFGRRRR